METAIDFASISARFIEVGRLAGIDPSKTSLVLGTGISSASQDATPFSIHLPGTYDAHEVRNGKTFESRAVIVVSWTLFRKWTAGEIASNLRVTNFVLGALIEGDITPEAVAAQHIGLPIRPIRLIKQFP